MQQKYFWIIGIIIIVIIVGVVLTGYYFQDNTSENQGQTLCNFNNICEGAESNDTCPSDCVGCVTEGYHIFEKDINNVFCCEGLEKLHFYNNIEKGCGESEFMKGNYVCSSCGDGTCGLGENNCNCPEDCK